MTRKCRNKTIERYIGTTKTIEERSFGDEFVNKNFMISRLIHLYRAK